MLTLTRVVAGAEVSQTSDQAAVHVKRHVERNPPSALTAAHGDQLDIGEPQRIDDNSEGFAGIRQRLEGVHFADRADRLRKMVGIQPEVRADVEGRLALVDRVGNEVDLGLRPPPRTNIARLYGGL